MINKRHCRCILLILGTLLCLGTLFAAELVYESASGKTYGFDLSSPDANTTPSFYRNTPTMWQTYADGFVGRLRYQGPETVVTLTQTAPFAQGTSNNMFYFTYVTEGNARVDVWREYFIVTTVKGLLHNKEQDPFVGRNTIIDTNGSGVPITASSGSATWPLFQGGIHPGFTSGGTSGYKTWGSDVFKYKHKYQYTWVDIVIIKRNQTRPAVLPIGSYTSGFTATTSEGLTHSFALFGTNSQGSSSHNYFFEIVGVVPKYFPYEMLKDKNSVQNSLHVANLSYYSLSDPVQLRIASDAGGTAASFKLYSPGVPPIPFEVVFTSTVPQRAPEHITSPNTAFSSVNKVEYSPIDGQNMQANFLDGKLQIFVSPNTMPMAGSYSGNIYCLLTQQ